MQRSSWSRLTVRCYFSSKKFLYCVASGEARVQFPKIVKIRIPLKTLRKIFFLIKSIMMLKIKVSSLQPLKSFSDFQGVGIFTILDNRRCLCCEKELFSIISFLKRLFFICRKEEHNEAKSNCCSTSSGISFVL